MLFSYAYEAAAQFRSGFNIDFNQFIVGMDIVKIIA